MNMVVNNGTLYKSDDVSDITKILASITDTNKIGLGKDSIKITATPKITEYDFAGKMDNSYADMEDITGWSVKLEGDCIDFNADVLGLSLMENATDTNTDYGMYVPKNTLSKSDYTNIICVGSVKGSDKKMIFVAKNCFNEDGIKATLKDKDNMAVSLTITAKCTLEDNKPFMVLTPKAS